MSPTPPCRWRKPLRWRAASVNARSSTKTLRCSRCASTGDLICDLTAESAAAGPTTHQAYTTTFAEASTPMSAAEWSALVLHDIIENGEK